MTTRAASSKPRPRSLAAWSRATEARQIDRVHHELKAARQRWLQLDPAERERLAMEAAETRGAELTLAYRNLVMVASGMKVRRATDGSHRTLRQPCVIFVVRRKWSADTAAAGGRQHLPRELLAYATVGERRQLVAIPTDVQPQDWFAGARSHGASSVDVLDATTPGTRGTLTCAVRVENETGAVQTMLLSAMHVFSPVPLANSGARATGTSLQPTGGGATIGRTLATSGQIRDDGALSFDVQLATIDDRPGVRRALADLGLSIETPWVRGAASFSALNGREFEIVRPTNVPDARGSLRARFRSYVGPAQTLDYWVRYGGAVQRVAVSHRQLLQFEVLEQDLPGPAEGDSGSAIVVSLPQGGRTLAGLYIGGPEGGAYAYAIPAWDLVTLDDWLGLPAGTVSVEPIDNLG